MKRSTFALSAAAALLLSGFAAAQVVNLNNDNDQQLNNGGDFIYNYGASPTPGPMVGTSGVPDYATNQWFWKVNSRDTMRRCNGTIELVGLDMFNSDGDYTATDINLLNTNNQDVHVTSQDTVNIPVNAGQIEPDQAAGVLFSFGAPPAGSVENNDFLTDPGCPPVGYINVYELDVDVTGGLGAGFGVTFTADGLTDLIQTVFIPGGSFLDDATLGHPNSCADNNGDGNIGADEHSGTAAGGPGEEGFDTIGGNLYSAFGGYGSIGLLGGTDVVKETYAGFPQFAEPIVVNRMNSNLGQGATEGLNGVHYDCSPIAGGQLGARLYAWQGIGRPGFVLGGVAPLAVCANLKGDKLGINPAIFPGIWSTFLNNWQGVVIQTDNGAPATNTGFDDGTHTTILFGLPPQVIAIGGSAALYFQGGYKKVGGLISLSQVSKLTLHG